LLPQALLIGEAGHSILSPRILEWSRYQSIDQLERAEREVCKEWRYRDKLLGSGGARGRLRTMEGFKPSVDAGAELRIAEAKVVIGDTPATSQKVEGELERR
jgi:hypothetical protein